MSKVKEVVPKINQATGLRVDKVTERSEPGDGYDRVQTILTLELKRPPAESDNYSAERNLMRAIIR